MFTVRFLRSTETLLNLNCSLIANTTHLLLIDRVCSAHRCRYEEKLCWFTRHTSATLQLNDTYMRRFYSRTRHTAASWSHKRNGPMGEIMTGRQNTKSCSRCTITNAMLVCSLLFFMGRRCELIRTLHVCITCEPTECLLTTVSSIYQLHTIYFHLHFVGGETSRVRGQTFAGRLRWHPRRWWWRRRIHKISINSRIVRCARLS